MLVEALIPQEIGVAGEPYDLKVTVTNKGQQPLFRLRAATKSDYPLFNGRELVFGKLMPGESREWVTTLGMCAKEDGKRRCILPRDATDRADGVKIIFEEALGHAPEPAEIRTRVQSIPRPQFSYDYQVADTAGDGDGHVERGESVVMFFDVLNSGKGKALKVTANLRNLGGPGVLLRDARFEIGALEPGETRRVAFTFDVLEDFEGDAAEVELSVSDTELREYATEKVRIPIEQPVNDRLTEKLGRATLSDSTQIYAAPWAGAKSVAQVRGGALSLKSEAVLGEYLRVDLGEGRPGWVKASAATSSGSGGRLEFSRGRMPPRLEVDYGEALVTRARTLKLRGKAKDDTRIRDVYVFVGSRKVFYQANTGADPKVLTFQASIPLEPGINYVSVFARENQDVITRDTVVVRRDGEDGTLLATPDHDTDAWDEMAAE